MCTLFYFFFCSTKNAEEFVFKEDAKVVVFSKGMEPTASEIGRIDFF
jgi:hypothetical protein